MNKIKNIITLICIAVILAVGIYYCYNYYTTMKELNVVQQEVKNAQQEILTIQNNLNDTTDMLNKEIKKYEDLNEILAETKNNLDKANEIISSQHGKVYFVDCEVTELEIEMLAKTVWGEARGCNQLEQSAVVWCVLNRVDAGRGTISEVIVASGQFHGYNKNYPVTDEIKALVEDVVARWKMEKLICGEVGRTLPINYLFFAADSTGIGNVFRTTYDGNYEVWNWDCWNPYE